MKTSSLVCFFGFLLIPALASAQTVSGRVWEAGGNNAAGATVTIACPGGASQAKTNTHGAYRLTSKAGECTAQITYQEKTSSRVTIFVKGNTKANFELAPTSAGWALRRK